MNLVCFCFYTFDMIIILYWESRAKECSSFQYRHIRLNEIVKQYRVKFRTNSSQPHSAPPDNEIEKVWDVSYSMQLNWLKFVHFLCEFELCVVNNQWNVSYPKEFTLKILAQLGLFVLHALSRGKRFMFEVRNQFFIIFKLFIVPKL